jgi:sulfur carrier protein
VTVKLFATLRDGRFDMEERPLPEGACVGDVVRELRIAEADAPLRFLNGRQCEMSTPLHDGDVLALFPPVGGG